MPTFSIPQEWTKQTLNRECGSCTACCIHLGITELKKYTGQKCTFLLGPQHLNKRCGIYRTRPPACSSYKCMWLEGWGPSYLRPKDSGILLTAYPSSRYPNKASITVNVFDPLKQGPISSILGNLLTIPAIDEVRIINLQTRKAMLYSDGHIYECQILPPRGYEDVTFLATDEPIGKYAVSDSEANAEANTSLSSQHTDNPEPEKPHEPSHP